LNVGLPVTLPIDDKSIVPYRESRYLHELWNIEDVVVDGAPIQLKNTDFI
jgi:hypothetical protein